MINKKLLSKSIKNDTGELVVLEEMLEQFVLKRLFFVHADQKCIRGKHAHIKCQQILICVRGQITVTFDDGRRKYKRTLKKNSDGILVPNGVWSEQTYKSRSILLVLCDRKFEEEDYIRDYVKFLKWKNYKE